MWDMLMNMWYVHMLCGVLFVRLSDLYLGVLPTYMHVFILLHPLEQGIVL